MATIPSTSYPISLGTSLAKKSDGKTASSSRSSLVAVKYNFRPPSIVQSTSGYLHSPTQTNSQWILEYNMREGEEDRRGARTSAQGFQGGQSAAKEVDCVLIWDETSQSYVLDQLSSTFSFKYDRGHSKLSEQAKTGLLNRLSQPEGSSVEAGTSMLGLELSRSSQPAHSDDAEARDEDAVMEEENNDDEDEFARQLELGLESFASDKKESEVEESEEASMQRAKTGLGLLEGSGLREDVLTPRGSPYIDRPKDHFGGTKSNLGQTRSVANGQAIGSNVRSTPLLSPASVSNSPRPAGLDSTLSVSSSWKPPAQRSNVAIAYDEDEEEGDEESDEEDEEEEGEEEEDDDDEEEDDDDLDDYARQLESSLQG